MLTIIIFSVLVLFMYVLNLILFWGDLSFLYITIATILSVIAELAINAVCAIVTNKFLPKKWFDDRVKIFNVSNIEYTFYVKVLKIKLWKDKTLELGSLNGFKKNKMQETANPHYLEKFIIECNSGLSGHFLSIVFGSLLIFAYPKTIILSMGLPTILINFIINYMSVAILRFNIPRLKSALKFSRRRTQKHQ